MRFPPEIRAIVGSAVCSPIDIGKSGASVFMLNSDTGILYLKICTVEKGSDLSAEAERLRWLADKLSVPRVVSFVKDNDREYLLLTSLPGVNGVDESRERPENVVIGLAEALKMLHEQPVAECPFDQTVAIQIERARQRICSGLVDETDFDEERLGCTAAELLVEIEAYQLGDERRVLTHGDPCLPNVIFDKGRFSGFVDCSRVGAADPYQDLALAARSIGSNLGEDWIAMFFERYGLQQPDRNRLAFYRLLDELF